MDDARGVLDLSGLGDAKPIAFERSGQHYVLEPASEYAVKEFRNAGANCTKVEDGAYAGIVGDVFGREAVLLSRCIFTAGDGVKRESVPVDTILGWPRPDTKRLFAAAEHLSDLKEDGDVDTLRKQRDALGKQITALEKGDSSAKNEPSDTDGG